MSEPLTLAETVRVRTKGRTAWVTLDRPPVNVLDIPAMRALSSELERLLPACDFLVFQGAGPKAFSAGAEVRDHAPDRVAEMLAAFHRVFRLLARADCLTIAAVQGHCLGGGMELATFCDFVMAAESARFGQPEIKLGCLPPVALITLPRLAGPRAALDLILSGRVITAKEARGLGLVTRVVADDALATSVDLLLAELHALSPAVLKLTRRALRRNMGDDGGRGFDQQLAEVERFYLETLMKTEDAQEGIRAFLEKRAPVWRSR